MAQSVKRLTLGFSSGHDLMVRGFKALSGFCTDSMEPAWDSLSPSLSLSLCPAPAHMCVCSLSISLKINE